MDLLLYAYSFFEESHKIDKIQYIFLKVEQDDIQYQEIFMEMITQIKYNDLSLFIELLAQKEIVSFFHLHLLKRDIEDLFILVDEDDNISYLYNTHFLPKECHFLLDSCRHQVRNRYSRYNCQASNVLNNPFRDIEQYASSISSGESKIEEEKIIEHIIQLGNDSVFIPSLLPILIHMTDESKRREILEATKKANYYDIVRYFRQLQPYDSRRKKWVRLNASYLFLTIFFKPDRENTCSLIDTSWHFYPQQWRCVYACEDHKEQCVNVAKSVFGYCSIHSITIAPKRVDTYTFTTIYKWNEMPIPNNTLIMGAYVIQELNTILTNENKFPNTSFTVVSTSLPPPPFNLTKINEELIQQNQTEERQHPDEIPKEIEFYDNENIIKAFSFTYITRTMINETINRVRLHVIWLQVNEIKPTSISILNVDNDVWMNPHTQIGYCKSELIQRYGRQQHIVFNFNTMGDNTNAIYYRNAKPKQFFYSIENAIKYHKTFKIEFLFKEDIKFILPKAVSLFFGNSVLELISNVIEWNVNLNIQNFEDEFLPHLLFILPFKHNKLYKWNDLKLTLVYDTQNLLYYDYYSIHPIQHNDEFTPMQLETETKSTTALGDKIVDVNNIFKELKPHENSISWNNDDILPTLCMDLMNMEDTDMNDFLIENKEDQPFVFFKRNLFNNSIQSACWTKSSLESQYKNEESKYYECLKEGMKYTETSRVFIQLSLFPQFQTYITETNYHFMMESDHIYWILSERPFFHLNFSIKKALYHGTAQSTPEDIELELGPAVSSHHCQAGTQKEVDVIYPVNLNKKRRVTIHV